MRYTMTKVVLLALSVAVLAAMSSVIIQAAAVPDCKTQKRHYDFGLCDPANNEMRALAYYKTQCQETEPHTVNPPKLVSCQASCPAGKFMDPAVEECSACPSGTYSRGSNVDFPSHESKAVVSWSTRCAPHPCEPWKAVTNTDGTTTFHSGNQSVGKRVTSPYYQYESTSNKEDESVISVLTLLVTILEPKGGSVRFAFRVESEHLFDGLVVFVNETAHFNPENYDNDDKTHKASFQLTEQNAPFYASGMLDDYKYDVLMLPYGTTEVRFIYRKDANQGMAVDPDDYGLDRAFLREFVVEGAKIGSAWCTPCPRGQYGNTTGSTSCKTCPKNTYSPKLGATLCTPCEKGWYSAPGSAECTKMLDCRAEDFVAIYTECDVKKKSRLRRWALPPDAICSVHDNAEAQAMLQKNETVPCGKCPFGGYRDVTTHQCAFCKPGFAASADGLKCVECTGGSYGQPLARFNAGFESLAVGASLKINPNFFKSDCVGDCADCGDSGFCISEGSAFLLTSLQKSDPDHTFVAIRSNTANGDYYHSSLYFPFNTTNTEGGTIRMTYFFAYPDVSPPSEMSILDPEIEVYAYLYDEKTYTGFSTPVELKMTPQGRSDARVLEMRTPADLAGSSTGPFTFELHLHKKQFLNPPRHKRLTFYITAFEADGDKRGAPEQCEKCPVGHYCEPRSVAPTPCPRGTHSPLRGAVKCEPCTGNFVATATGLSTCTPCYEGSDANADHTWCDMECKVTTPRGQRFDFSPAKPIVYGPIPDWTKDLALSDGDSWDVHRYFFSICDHVPPHYCPFLNGKRVKSSVMCQRINENRSYSLGDERKIAFDDYNGGKPVLMLKMGDSCFGGLVPRTANITLLCDSTMAIDPKNNASYGRFTFLGEGPTCHYNFHLTSALACPLCEAKDFRRVEGDCTEQNLRTISYLKKRGTDGSTCYGGEVPNDTTERCQRCTVDSYEIVWGACDEKTQLEHRITQLKASEIGCWDNGSIIQIFDDLANKGSASHRQCSHSFSSRFLPYIIVLVIVVSLSLLWIIISLQRKHSKLRMKYDRLASDVHGVGMEHQVGTEGTSATASDVRPAAAPISSSAVGTALGNNNSTSAQDDDDGGGYIDDEFEEAMGNDVHPAAKSVPGGMDSLA